MILATWTTWMWQNIVVSRGSRDSIISGLKDDNKVIVIGATNRPNSLDQVLRRAVWFDPEVCLGIPERQFCLPIQCWMLYVKIYESIHQIIESIKKRLHSQLSDFIPDPYSTIERNTVKDSLNLLLADNIMAKEDLSEIYIKLSDFNEALKKVVPSSKKEGFVTVAKAVANKSGTPVLEHASYSPDLAPCNFYLFPKIKSALKGIRFESMEEVKQKSAELLNDLTKSDFQHCLEQWKKRMKRCLARGGEYLNIEYRITFIVKHFRNQSRYLIATPRIIPNYSKDQ
ncbi:Hypothetical protein CINCED_3A014989, partial [Cinara cedri]